MTRTQGILFSALGWDVRTKFDGEARELADRHYSRRTVGSPQFAPPGRTSTIVRPGAVWVSRIEARDRTTHAWPGAWQNTIFRNESRELSSDLIRSAVEATVRAWGPIPSEGFLSMIDPGAVRSTNPGFCYLQAGWRHVGWTKGGHGRAKLRALMLHDHERGLDPDAPRVAPAQERA